MKVLHLIGGGDTGGAKTHVLNLLKELNNHIDAQLVCFIKGEFFEDAVKMDIPITVIDTPNPIQDLRELKKLMGKQKVDIIHCHGARGNLMGVMIRKYLKAPVITTVHSDYKLDYLGRPVARFSYGTTYALALRKVDYYIGVSDPMTDLLIGRNFPADKIYTIYNGIDFKTPLKHSSRQEYFDSLGFPVGPEDVVAGIAARLNPVKDIPTLLKAMKVACAASPNLKLVIAGNGEDEEKLKHMAKELGIAKKVCFAGWVSDMNSFYNSIDINLLTSISETFPYALTEGARMSKPTIASRVGGVPVLIDDGKNGFIFEPRNYQQLADKLIELSTNRMLRESMGKLLYEKSSKMFSIDSMVEVQLDIYKSVLIRNQRRKDRKRDGIIVCGAYGHGNAGDDAILKSIINAVREEDPYMPITILAKNIPSIKKKFRVNSLYTFDMISMFLAMRKSLLYINGGGSLIQNVTSSRSLAYYLLTLKTAKLTKNKVDMYGCGIGPVNGKGSRKWVARILNSSVDAITLREPHSMQELSSYGVDKPVLQVTCDPALTLEPSDQEEAAEYLKKRGISLKEKYACYMLRNWQDFSKKAEEISACADMLYENYGLKPVFISMNTLHDSSAAESVGRHMRSPYIILDDPLEPEMLISIMSYMDLVLAMRLHGLIFASISGVPMVGLSYDPKINSFLKYLGYGECIDFPDIDRTKLYEAACRAYNCNRSKAELAENAQRLAESEHNNILVVRELLSQIDNYT